MYQTSFTESDLSEPKEFVFFGVLGIVIGLMGVAFIYLHDIYVFLRRKYQSRMLGDNPYGIAIVVICLFTTILFFIGDFAIKPARKAVSDMFNIEFLENCDSDSLFASDADLECTSCSCVENILSSDISRCEDNMDDILCQQSDSCQCHYHDWVLHGGLYANLSAFYCLNYLFAIGAVTLSFPCGIFAPIFTLGSVAGRIFGELLRSWHSFCDPRVYSVVGAAAMAAGVTQTISPAVIALEITGDLKLAVPCLLAVIVSGGVSGSLIHSFYDSVLQLRGIPMLPIRPTVAYKRVFIKPPRIQKSKNSSKSPTHSQSKNAFDFDMDSMRIGIDSKPEIFDANSGKSNNSNIVVLNAQQHEHNKLEKRVEARYRLLIADDVMLKEFSFVTIDPSSADLIDILLNNVDQEWFPVVHSASECVLVGEARRSVLMDLLKTIDHKMYQTQIPQQLRAEHDSFFNQSATQIKDKASLMNDTLLLNEAMEPTQKKQRSTTFGSLLARNWRKNDAQPAQPAAVEMLAENENENKNENESDDKRHITLMSSGFIERINLSPIQVISEMPLTKIYTLFHILKPQNVYVTKYSRLIGVINEIHLLKREFRTQQTSKKAKMYCLKCNKLCRDCGKTICCCCC